MSNKIKLYLRTILGIRSNESISEGIRRRKIKFEKKIYRKKITKVDLKKILIELGIKKGDNLIVHSSWRQFYNFLGQPEDIIEILKDIIEEGTLLMPSYGKDRTFFDVDKTQSAAGVISEVFRKSEGVLRSKCTHFSMAVFGKEAEYLIKDHFESEYGFDQNSPYFKFINLKESKILFLGLGREPTKISLFHCAGYFLKEQKYYFKKLLSEEYYSKLIVDGIEYKKKMLIRKKGHANNNKNFKKIFRSISNKNYKKISNLELVVFDAKEGFQKTIEFAEKKIYCYK